MTWLRRHAALAVAGLASAGEVRVRIVDDGEMAAAHLRFKGEAGPTDVLTFDLSDGGELDIDILICLDEAVRQGRERGHGEVQELLLYIIHGVLHCTGYDDLDEEGARRMHLREDQILEQLGVGATYGTGKGTGTQSGKGGR